MRCGKIKWTVVVWLASAGLSAASSITDQWLGGTGVWSAAADWSAGSPNNAGSTTYAVAVASGGGDQVTLDVSFRDRFVGHWRVDGQFLRAERSRRFEPANRWRVELRLDGNAFAPATGTSWRLAGASIAAESSAFSGSALLGVTGSLTNSNTLGVGGGATLTVGGALNNQTGTGFNVNGTASVNTLNNAGQIVIGSTGTLNLTGGGLGVTDIAAGSWLNQSGAFNVINGGVATNALANLATVEGTFVLVNGQTLNLTSLNNSGNTQIDGTGTTLGVTGSLTNSNVLGVGSGATMAAGTLNNGANASFGVSGAANVNTLNNAGTTVVTGTLNLTAAADLA